MSRPAEDEIIEDSEPEREQRRIQRKAKRKTSNCISGIIQTQVDRTRKPLSTSTRLVTHEVIVISDESDLDLRRKASALTNPEKQRKTADFVLEQEDLEPLAWESFRDEIPSLITRRGAGDAAGKSRDAPPITVHSASDLSEDEDVNHQKKLPNFAQYAYTGSRSSSVSTIHRPPALRGASVISPETTEPIDAPSVARSSAKPCHRFTVFEDSELASLRKCVSCGLSWTLRKTVAQKMKHIQTCAKKNKLNDETVTTLIRAELTQDPKGVPNVSKVPGAKKTLESETLLENAVQDGPKKKGRRAKVVESVKQLSDTRESILERARLLLHSQTSSISSAGQALVGQSQPEAAASVGAPPPTQGFAESALAQKYRLETSSGSKEPLLYAADSSSWQAHYPDPKSPPRTQAFGESELAKQFQAKASYLDHNSSPVYIPSPLAQINQELDPVQLSPTPRHLELSEDAEFVLGRGLALTDNPIFPAFSPGAPPDTSENAENPSRRPPANWPPGNVAQGGLPQARRDSLYPTLTETYSPRSVDNDAILHFDPELDKQYDSQYSYSDTESKGAMLHYEPSDFHSRGDIHDYSFSSSSSSARSVSPLCTRRSSSPLITEDLQGKVAKPKRAKPRRAVSQTHNSDDETPPVQLSQSKRGRKPKSKKVADVPPSSTATTSKTKGLQLTDDELFAKLRESILKDTQLYLRILRYEPIHVDVFLKHAADTGVTSKGLKLRVKAFLDKQAIHFYGLGVSRSRTKRRRSRS